MSAARFLTITKSRVATSTAPRFLAVRPISSTASLQKGPVDATKDTLKAADRTVSDAAVKGINMGGRLTLDELNQLAEDVILI